MNEKQKRIGSLDFYRYLTVTLAIISHVVGSFEFGASTMDDSLFLKVLTRSATPSLLILYGVMTELVYARRYERDRVACYSSLAFRSLLCYLAFISLAAIAFLANPGQFLRLLAAVPLIAPVENANIFKMYAILLLLTGPILMVRARFGVLGLIAFTVALWLFHAIALSGLPPLMSPFHHMGSLLFGVGNRFGPTILHSSVLVVFGIVLANSIYASERMRFARVAAATMLLGSLALLAVYIETDGMQATAMNIADISLWRSNHHPGYYAFGIVASVAILATSYLLGKVLPSIILRPLEIVGGTTLMYFFIANAALAVMHPPQAWSAADIIARTTTFVLGSSAAAYAWHQHGRSLPLVKGFNERLRQLSDFIVRAAFDRKQPFLRNTSP